MRIIKLLEITSAVPLSYISEDQMAELQIVLTALGYPVGVIDGLYGPKTRNAWSEFKTDVFYGHPDLIGPDSIETLSHQLEKVSIAGKFDFSNKEGTIESIKLACIAHDINLKTQISYVLATVEWETAQTFKPVKETFWRNERWREDNLRYYPYYGRGYVQLTWEHNYEKYGRILGIDLTNNPDLAMQPGVALFVLVHGFKTGGFTGRKLSEYINAVETDFIKARRCINGSDKAHDIAQIAQRYLDEF